MKKFEFRLNSALRVYGLKLELDKTKLSQILAEEQQILHSIAKHAEDLRLQNDALRQLVELRSGDLRALSAYNLSAQTHNIALHESLGRVRRLIRLQRETVLRDERKVRLLSKLREKKFSEWEQIVNRQMEAEAQEIWSATHGRGLTKL
jgi:hypothetical protein